MMTVKKTDNVAVMVTGLGWMKQGIRSIWSVMEDMIKNASDEIQIAVYLITTGSTDFLQLLKNDLNRGIRITFLVNSFFSQPVDVQKQLYELANKYPYFVLLDFIGTERETLHAKIIVVDRKVAFIGSSNLTGGGLTYNHEIGVRIEGPAAKQIAEIIDLLGIDPRTHRVESEFV